MNLYRKIFSPKGETLTETLCAVLIVAIASVGFATMVGVSADMNKNAKAQNKELYDSITVIESKAKEGTEKSFEVEIDGEKVPFDIKLYTENGLSAYSLKEVSEP